MLHLNKKLIIALTFGAVWMLFQACQKPTEESLDQIYTNYYEATINGVPQKAYYGRPGALLTASLEEEEVKIEIENGDSIKHVEIIPENSCQKVVYEGSKLLLKVNKESNFFVKINNNYVYPLMISVTKPFEVENKNTIVYEEGIHEIGVLEAKSNQTFLLKKGAYLKGTIVMENVENVKLFGQGVVNGTHIPESSKRAGILIKNAKNIEIAGVSFIDAPHNHFVIKQTENIQLKNIKVIGNRELRMGDDAFDIYNSKNVTLTNVISNTRNNCLAFMNENNTPSENITVDGAIFWKGDYGNVLEVSYLAENIELKNIQLSNIDIAHALAGAGVALKAKGMQLENVSIHNLKMHDNRYLVYAIQQDETARFQSVHFSNHHYTGQVPAYSNLIFGSEANAANITFENITYKGKQVQTPDDLYVKEYDFMPNFTTQQPGVQ